MHFMSNDWQLTLNKRMWQRAGLLVARLGICHHLTNHGGNAPPPWASDRGAISIRGDEAHPNYALAISNLSPRVQIHCK